MNVQIYARRFIILNKQLQWKYEKYDTLKVFFRSMGFFDHNNLKKNGTALHSVRLLIEYCIEHIRKMI